MRRTVLALALLLTLACGGGGGGGGGPTLPPQPIQMQASIGFATTINGGATAGVLSFDGREIGRENWTAAFPQGCPACTITGSLSDVSRGGHTLSVTITSQSRPSISYFFTGVVIVTDSQGQHRIDLAQRTVSLRAGESISYSITI